MTKDEALKLAAKDVVACWKDPQDYGDEGLLRLQMAIDQLDAAIKQALAAPVQEPFCFVYVENGEEYFAPKGAYVPDNAQPLYTTPPAAQRQWIGLTDEERKFVRNSVGYNQFVTAGEYAEHVQKATEAKLKERNT